MSTNRVGAKTKACKSGENFVFCRRSVFVGSLSDPTVRALGRGVGCVGHSGMWWGQLA